MSRIFAVGGGLLFVVSLLFFVASFGWLYEGGGAWSWSAGARPALVNVLVFTGFALHHSIFARAVLKRRVERLWPHLERSIYVWIASLLFLVVCAAWQPVPGVVWRVSGWPAWLLRALQLGGGVFAVVTARRLDVLALAGIRQASQTAEPIGERSQASPALDDRGPYRFVRHPIYLGWCLMVGCPPVMNGTRLLFAAASCLYLLIAIPYEERGLRATFGDAYKQYAARVRWRIIPFVY